MPMRSMIEPGFRPEIVPTGRPPMSHSIAAPTARLMLTGSACQISVDTCVLSRNE